jgi:hypothetical protein
VAELTTKDYMADLKQQRERYGEPAEGPSLLRDRVTTQPIAARISDLATQVADAAHRLEEARVQSRLAGEQRSKCEVLFAQASEALMQAINEHREGTPENVPYQP